MPGTLSEIWRATADRDPEARALVIADTGETFTRRNLAGKVEAWAASVPDSRNLHRRRVAFSEPNGLGWWTAFLGLLQLRAVPVPIDAAEPEPRQLELARGARATRLWSGGRWTDLGPRRAVGPGECLVKLTSGSAGSPRPWPFTHAQMLADGMQVCATMDIRPDDRVLGAIPLGHSYGLGNLVLPLITQGTELVLVAPPLPNVLASAIERWRCTVFPAVPALLDALCRSTTDAPALDTLRVVISAGATLPPALAAAFHERFAVKVHNFYGTSETGGICFDRSGDATLAGRSVGTPLQGVTLRWRRHRRFVVESAAVRGDGSFSPADLGLLNAFGELVLLGRTGRVVKIGARRLDLGEIEAAIRSIPGVRDAYAAIDPSRRHRLVAAIATDLPKEQVRAELRARVAAWKQPDRLLLLPAFPVTARGKPDRAAIEQLLLGKSSDAEAPPVSAR